MAEEWRSRHLDILLARPIGPAALVVGKWLAAVGFFVLLLVPTLVYCVFLAPGANPTGRRSSPPTSGRCCSSALFAAVGTMASALTPTAVAAGLGAFALLVVAQLANNVPAFRGLSFQPHLESFARGAPGLEDIVYFVTGIVAPLVVAGRLADRPPARGDRPDGAEGSGRRRCRPWCWRRRWRSTSCRCRPRPGSTSPPATASRCRSSRRRCSAT